MRSRPPCLAIRQSLSLSQKLLTEGIGRRFARHPRIYILSSNRRDVCLRIEIPFAYHS